MQRAVTDGRARVDGPRPTGSIRQGMSAMDEAEAGNGIDEAEAVNRVAERLRGPLTAVLAYSQILESRGASLPEGRLADLHDRLATSARELAGLLEDLLGVDPFDQEAC